MTTTPRLSSRGYAVAEHIRDRKTFKTSGSLSARVTSVGSYDYGELLGPDRERFIEDSRDIDYVVWSYVTPIAWHVTMPDGTERWHKVEQRFSPTTGKHQGKLYLIPEPSKAG